MSEVKVGKNETLLFGDPDMQFSFVYYRGETKYQLIRSIFDKPTKSGNSLPIKVEGYWYFGGEE